MSRVRIAAAIAGLGLYGQGAFAQSAAESAEPPVLTQFVSAGAAMLPDYAGSDDFRVIPFGALRVEWGEVVIRTDGPGLAAELYEAGPVTLGVYGRWSGGRNEVEDAVVSLLPEVDNSIFTGVFAEIELADEILSPVDSLTLGVKAGADALGTVDGIAWTGSLTYAGALSRRSFYALSASVSGFSDDYADTLFSVDAAGATASGLPVYTAGGGVQDLGLTGIYTYGFTERWSLTTILGWSRLLGDYADSPLVAVRGDENQYFLGLALGRRF
ncbi:MAG: MipA/OmpV family protein [Oceanicaulis sp.]